MTPKALSMSDDEVELMLKVAAEVYAQHKGVLSRANAKRQRSEAVWLARRNGWKLKNIAHIIGLSISRTAVL